jgi:proline racemase
MVTLDLWPTLVGTAFITGCTVLGIRHTRPRPKGFELAAYWGCWLAAMWWLLTGGAA